MTFRQIRDAVSFDCYKLIVDDHHSTGSGRLTENVFYRGSEIFAAYEEGCAALVTGEIKHHEINTANDLGVTVIDAGHFKSENVVIMPLVNKLGKRFSDIIFTKSKNYDDNIKFC